MNYGVCEKCKQLAPARHVVRDGRVYLTKDCATCGTTEALVSTDAAIWQSKRDLFHYDPERVKHACKLNCTACGHLHHPRMVFLNVTNRCNMNCPICIANIPGMGFEFHPPLEYFEHVLDGLAQFDPLPTVLLFGGEPTVRNDMFDIIKMAEDRKLRVGIVTNGLRLADEEFCKRVCESKARILIAFDGRNPEIYTRLRKSPNAYEKKLKAFENLKKFSRRKHTIMCCVARNINDKYMRDLIDFCHENRDFIANMHMIPLTETWKEGEFATDITTTIEDVEQIITEAFPGEHVDFIPAGLPHRMKRLMPFLGSPRLTFGGVHPNCESATILFSDGTRYWPVGRFFRRPLREVCAELIDRSDKIDAQLERLDPKTFIGRWRGRWLIYRTFGGLMRKSINWKQVTQGHPVLAAFRMLGGLLTGRGFKKTLIRCTGITNILGMIVLPFEESHSVEAERLKSCTAGFAFEDPDDGHIFTIPVCSFSLYRDIERKIADKYAKKAAAAASV